MVIVEFSELSDNSEVNQQEFVTRSYEHQYITMPGHCNQNVKF